MKKYLHIALAWTTAIALVVGTATIFMFSLGPRIETAVFPVIDKVQATLVQNDKQREILHLAALGNKERQCEWKAITAMVFRDGSWRQGSVYFTDPRKDKTPDMEVGISRPVGSQSLGEIFVFPSGEKVQVYLYHNCHPFWQTMTFLYELDFSKTPYQVR